MLFKIFIITCMFSFAFSLCTVTYLEVVPKGERTFIGFISHCYLLIEDDELENSKTVWIKVILLSEILSISFYLYILIFYYFCFR